MAGAPKPERDRVSMGIYLERGQREEADRIAAAAGLTPTQVLRMAIEAGLPDVARRLLDDNGAAA